MGAFQAPCLGVCWKNSPSVVNYGILGFADHLRAQFFLKQTRLEERENQKKHNKDPLNKSYSILPSQESCR